MKIAIVPGAFFPNPGGAQVQAHNLANKICEKRKVICYNICEEKIKLSIKK